MNFSSLNDYLRCVEAVLLNDNNSLINFNDEFNTKEIDLTKTEKYVPSKSLSGEFVEYSSILNNKSTSAITNTTQTDILLSLIEPVYLYCLNSEKTKYLIIKFYHTKIKQSVLYSFENLKLIESVLKLWLQINLQNMENKIVSPIYLDKVAKNQLLKIDWLNDELNKSVLFIEKMLNSICSYLISDLNTESLDISLSDSTIAYIRNSEMDINSLKLKLQNAYRVARSLSPNEKNVRIKKYFITEEENTQNELKMKTDKLLSNTIEKPSKPVIKAKIANDNSLKKTENLLDKYESVAKILDEKNLPILGKNISAFCTPPISPPALTDSINKHSSRIKKCLIKYPDKWALLRNNYKPVRNLLME